VPSHFIWPLKRYPCLCYRHQWV